MLFSWNNKAYHEYKKTHDLIKKEDTFDRKSLVALSDYNRLEHDRIKIILQDDRTKVIILNIIGADSIFQL